MTVYLPFNERKATEAAARLLKLDILRAGGKTESEVAAIEAELAELAAADFLQPTLR